MDSKLQIISGRYSGKKLSLPNGARPTQNRARIAIFNMLENIMPLNDRVVWDAFAGSGAFGIEFLSRYQNTKVKFTDTSFDSILAIKKNTAGISGDFTIEPRDAIAAIDKYGAASDIVFIDAPYARFDLVEKFIDKYAKNAKKGAILIIEIEKSADLKLPADTFTILKDKTYGIARFLIAKM